MKQLQRGLAAHVRISGFSDNRGNVMFSYFYDIIAEVIAAQRFAALALLVAAR
jgi:hypothetical protein